jgi:hypothetical protein
MKFVQFFLSVVAMMVSMKVSASDLKIFGPEFCTPYDAGSCINFDYKKLKDAKTLFGQYKYPKGRKAFDDCQARSDQTDGGLAYCAMLFHREEQTVKERAAMCEKPMRDKYWETIRGDYAMGLYLQVWNCTERR